MTHKIQEAWEVLRDSEKKKQYDKMLEQGIYLSLFFLSLISLFFPSSFLPVNYPFVPLFIIYFRIGKCNHSSEWWSIIGWHECWRWGWWYPLLMALQVFKLFFFSKFLSSFLFVFSFFRFSFLVSRFSFAFFS